MYRKLIGILLCMLCVLPAACSTRVPVETVAPSGSSAGSGLPAGFEDIPPDSLLSCAVRIEGDEFKLPMAYSEVEAMGWAADEATDLDELLNAKNTTYEIYIQKGSLRCAALFVNYSNKAQPMRDCYIYSLWSYSADSNMGNFTLPGSLVSGVATKDDAIALYGQPKYDSDEFLAYYYSSADWAINIESIAKFGEDGLLMGFRLTYNGQPAGYVQDEVDASLPEIVADYKPPASMSDDLDDYVFRLDGKLYKLPCPVSELLDDGWQPGLGSSFGTYGGMAVNHISFWKEGRELSTLIKNMSENATAFENCAVIGAFVSEEFDFEVAFGIKVGMKQSELKEIIKDLPYEEDKYGYHVNADTSKLNTIPSLLAGYHIDINDAGIVDRIQVYEDTADNEYRP